MKVTEEWITPDIAKGMLLHNNKNRNIRKLHVEMLAADMRGGMWKGVSLIVFDKRGELRDGQHRLKAVVESGVPVKFAVARDAEDSECEVFDRNAKRRAEDIIRLKDSESPFANKHAANTVTYALRSMGILHPTPLLTVAYGQKHEDDFVAAMDIVARRDGKRIDGVSFASYTRATVYFALRCGIDKDKVKEFFAIFKTGMYDGSNGKTAAVVARNQIQAPTKHEMESWGKGGHGVKRFNMFSSVLEQALLDFCNDKPRQARYKMGPRPLMEKVKDADKKEIQALMGKKVEEK